ncbi:hypothetical protein [Halorubellus salinus]|uniref:hypothetical protein n=1 Tax=Halorubellus salinus TaxID=755309 RepID=UPI001D087169|nr:hypothetical protein [Halorubellus salinus]
MRSRRRLLAALPTTIALAGCVGTRSPRADLGTISVENNAAEAIEIAVRVERNGDVVVDDSTTVPTADEAGRVVVRESTPGDPGRYVLHTSVAGTDETETSEFTTEGCVDVLVKYWPSSLSHYTKTRDGSCSSRERLDDGRSAAAVSAPVE